MTTASHLPLIGKSELITRAFRKQDLICLQHDLVRRLDQAPDDAHAMLDLSMVLLLNGQREQSLSMQGYALQAQQIYFMPARRQPVTLRLLVFVGPGDFMANTPLEFLIADSSIDLYLLYLGPGIPVPKSLPPHDVAMVAVGENVGNRKLLQGLVEPLGRWHTPVLNLPARVLSTSRDGLHAALRGAPGIVSPALARTDRLALDELARGAANLQDILPEAQFPILVRPVDSNAGENLEKIDAPAELSAYLGTSPGDDFFVSQFVDYRGPDGLYRKYRIVLIQGRAYLGHMGISRRWMVHYLNADMQESAANRAEEGAAMRNFDQEFGARHAQAFRTFHERVGLDYLIIDCGETPSGELLVFEADTCGIVHDMDPEDLYPYKKSQMHKVFAAFQAMLADCAARATGA
ncbi:hypothetical protein [Bordetella sp. FB-8]|uniref:hypothetical protein n=1 Tax=Bordetella sp. FB-8 TaxID=1159870 RepID=UPI00037AC8EC|nr:hypothetical protein [Bordetella sp. FB-8]